MPTSWLNPGNGFFCVKLHYTADPEKQTDDWKRKAHAGMSERSWQQEMEIDFTVYADCKPVYMDFNQAHIRSLSCRKDISLHRGWDLGAHYPACVFAQYVESSVPAGDNRITKIRKLHILKEIQGVNIQLDPFITHVEAVTEKELPSRGCYDYSDPQIKHVIDTSRSRLEFFRAHGLSPRWPTGDQKEIEYGHALIAKAMQIQADGEPGLLIDPSCEILIEGFRGGYNYAEPMIEEQRPKPEDSEFKHLQDALRYMGVFVLSSQPEHDAAKPHNATSFDLALRRHRLRQKRSKLMGNRKLNGRY